MRMAAAALTGILLGCSTGPSGPLEHQVWVLVSVNDQALPAKPSGLSYPIVADTLEFGVESPQWKPKPLARASRWSQIVSEHGNLRQELWYTYDPAAPTPFAIRILCADGDLADCLNGNGRGRVEGGILALDFEEVNALGRLRYRRIR